MLFMLTRLIGAKKRATARDKLPKLLEMPMEIFSEVSGHRLYPSYILIVSYRWPLT